ncbi:MAG TPA: ThiF family adenylyltransferase [Candidatus Deferrimicrobium sp.]|nr:ThiF family adenylyltransferase [Candidatus Deferrimicrobium sp.]
MKLLFQNADTGDNFEVDFTEKDMRIRTIAQNIMKKFDFNTPPIFFTIFKEQPTQETFLEEDYLLISIREKKLDEKTPIWFRSSKLHPDTIYKLRTERFSMSGYKIAEISQKSVLIAGIGLIGADLAAHCATIGIKKLFVLDYGSVDWYNIYRQSLYLKKDVFQLKVEVACKNLEERGGLEVIPIRAEIPSFISNFDGSKSIEKAFDAIESYIKQADYIITALDTFSARMTIQTLALATDKILINTAAGLIGGIIQLVRPVKDPCLACGVYFERAQDMGACTLATFGTPKIIAGLAIDLLLDVIEDRPIDFNHLKFNPNYTLQKGLFEKGSSCNFCDSPHGIIASYRNGNKQPLIDWLLKSD